MKNYSKIIKREKRIRIYLKARLIFAKDMLKFSQINNNQYAINKWQRVIQKLEE